MPPSSPVPQLKPWRVVSVGIPALFGSRAAINTLAAADHELELQRNTQLRQAASEKQAEHRAHSGTLVLKRLSLLRGIMVKSFASMASAAALAYVLKATGAVIPTSTSVLAISSAFCFAWATLGRLGWGGQSHKGDTAVERVDQYLFHLLYWLGMYLATAAVL
jgi:hypothetical protein